ncbi:LytR C-terminal domain-containing protein [Pseudoscardovia radai]|jgi:hypothetical protein|uniref:LytR C-terminal domain-containing protein n=1 Tax=Pseudoscardovia radai TaxID=987066 RepID=UPI0039953631
MAGRISSNEREARKLFVHDRHRMAITIAIAILVLALVISIPTAAGLFDKTSEAEAVPNYGVTAPCVATGTAAVDPSKITVRVLNGTDKSGLATAVASELQSRGFINQGVDNFPDGVIDRTEIRFGKNAVAEAYTLLGHFNDAILRMDDRQDALIDVVIGESFYDLLDTDQVTTLPGSTLESIKGCVSADSITDLPAAVAHTEVAVGSTAGSGTAGDALPSDAQSAAAESGEDGSSSDASSSQ